jgi:glycosyltransferase involved in cell wall biosynthesis
MKESDTISVLVCVHSRDHEHDMLLQRALESLCRQTYTQFETVVVLDECWEDTKSLVESYASTLGIRLFEKPHKQGLAVAKNFGLQRCSGDWIAYLDADDQWMDCKLAVQRQWLLDHPEVDFCGTNAWDLIDGTMVPNCFSTQQYSTHDEIVKRLPQENILCHGSMMIRRIAMESLKGYSTERSCLGKEDWALWQRAVASGFRFGKVPERLYIYSLGTSVPR